MKGAGFYSGGPEFHQQRRRGAKTCVYTGDKSPFISSQNSLWLLSVVWKYQLI